MGADVRIETATLNLKGYRYDNQDRVGIESDADSVIGAVIDGMGGHADGDKAAEVALASVIASFKDAEKPIFDPRNFLRDAIADAHQAVLDLGAERSIEQRPRATCALWLVQNGYAYWGHVGDSRVYLLRNRKVFKRTRDHSHVEVLVKEGLITEEEAVDHPLRNYVEVCLGGDPETPQSTVAGAFELERGDVLLACTDGLWGGLDDSDIAEFFHGGFPDLELEANLKRLGDDAVMAGAPTSDNTSAAVLHWLGK